MCIDPRPPCWPNDQPCPNSCAQAHHTRIVRNHTELHGPWFGWRMAGKYLVSPEGVRLTPERLKGLAWRQDAEARRDAARARNTARKAVLQGGVTVIRMPYSDWHRERFGSSAG